MKLSPITLQPPLVRDPLSGAWREVECEEHAPRSPIGWRTWLALGVALLLVAVAVWGAV